MKMSESISNIATALSTFQAMVANVKKEATNPHFKSKYASLDEIITTIRPYMEKTGLSFIQNPECEQGSIGVSTIIIHKSGEFIHCDAVMIPLKQDTPHQVGAALTYARRYSLGSALGVATEEDLDGNVGKKQPDRTQDSSAKYEPRRAAAKSPLLPDSWNKLAEENTRSAKQIGLSRKRFFAICKDKNLSDKQQKAIVFLHTAKMSRKDVTMEEFMRINNNLQNASPEEIQNMLIEALKLYRQGDVVNE